MKKGSVFFWVEAYKEADGALLQVAKVRILEGVEAGGKLLGENELAELLVVHVGGLPDQPLRPREPLLHRPSTATAHPVPHRVRVMHAKERAGKGRGLKLAPF